MKEDYNKIFVASDHHFGHANILKFFRSDGKTKVRPQFNNLDDMNHAMIERHNKVVGDSDKIYFLGDVAFDIKVFHEVMPQLKGRKRLILGNHDHFSMDTYLKYFKTIYSARKLKIGDKKVMLCHYPLHPDSELPNRVLYIHGHIHEKFICTNSKIGNIYAHVVNRNYVNVAVEQINYTPVSLQSIVDKM